MSKIIVYVNGSFVDVENAKISFRDGGFQFGDGLFETIRFRNKTMFSPHKHFERLRSGLQILNLKLGNTNDELFEILELLIDKNDINSGLLRLMITRGEITGTPWNHEGKPGIYISIRPISPLPQSPVKVIYFDESNYPIIRFNPAIKSMNYIGNMKAKQDAERKGAYEPVFYNEDGIITECAIRNIFFIKNNELITPSLDLGVLPGVMRSTIIDIAKKMDITVHESHIHYHQINTMDEAFISSTGIGLLPCYWDKWESEYKNTQKIKSSLNKLM
jgi:branched-subunit amino acid aminotransferase/4-amino-4-deoxychorismate lyase